ncbi:MAG: prepilin-type N-terminal cleavage/methylation domain-containing protein [Verrucomicrobiota bacterium]
MKMSVECRVSSVEVPKGRAKLPLRRRRGSAALPVSAFTLAELLVVIAIIGIMAGLAVPVLKNFAKSDATISASRQLLDGVARARQLAISQRTTVYMVFVPTNFWVDSSGNFPGLAGTWWGSLAPTLQTAATNLADRQLSGYNFLAHGALGDQPGQHLWHYLDRWQSLPDGTFIALAKFTTAPGTSYPINDIINPANPPWQIYGFHVTNNIPFPTEQGTNASPDQSRITVGIWLPYIAFNYLGQLTVDGQTLAPLDEYIPLAKGSIIPAADPGTKAPVLPGAKPGSPPPTPSVAESPPGNSTNTYNIVHIDRLTGRAVLEYQKAK